MFKVNKYMLTITSLLAFLLLGCSNNETTKNSNETIILSLGETTTQTKTSSVETTNTNTTNTETSNTETSNTETSNTETTNTETSNTETTNATEKEATISFSDMYNKPLSTVENQLRTMFRDNNLIFYTDEITNSYTIVKIEDANSVGINIRGVDFGYGNICYLNSTGEVFCIEFFMSGMPEYGGSSYEDCVNGFYSLHNTFSSLYGDSAPYPTNWTVVDERAVNWASTPEGEILIHHYYIDSSTYTCMLVYGIIGFDYDSL